MYIEEITTNMVIKLFCLAALICLVASRDVDLWRLNPNFGIGENGITGADLEMERKDESHGIYSSWPRVVDPGKAKPTWEVGQMIRWRTDMSTYPFDGSSSLQEAFKGTESRVKRSPGDNDEPWRFDPNLGRGEDGNTRADLELERKGENHDIHASWSKVVDGPGKAKPTWNVGGTIRWRRDLPTYPSDDSLSFHEAFEETESRVKRSPGDNDEPWRFNPNLGRGEDGNTRADLELERKGENHDIHASWSKVVDGPGKAKPTWNVGGTIRWRRDLPTYTSDDSLSFHEAFEETESRVRRSPGDNDEPWRFNPNLGRGEDGNTRADLELERKGENHDIHASWSKVVDGPGKAKPTWNVGGTIRWRRDLSSYSTDETLTPNLGRGEDRVGA